MANPGVALDTAISQERPVTPDFLDFPQIYLGTQYLFPVVRSFGQYAAERVGKKRLSPELQAGALRLVATNVPGFMSHTICYRDEHAVCNGVRALDGAPRIVLSDSILLFLCGMPTDRGGIEEHLRALQCGQSSAFGVPLVPADQRADAS